MARALTFHGPRKTAALIASAVIVVGSLVLAAMQLFGGEDHGGRPLSVFTQDELLVRMNNSPGEAARLPTDELEFSHAAPPPTLRDAAAKATLIVHGTVTGIVFKDGHPGVNSLVTFRVAGVIKGDPSLASAEVAVVQPGGPVNYPDDHGVVTSQYRVANGRIAPVEGNPFASEVEGLPYAAYRQAVQRAADSP